MEEQKSFQMVWQPVVRCTAKSGPVNWNQQFDRCVSLKMQLGVDQWHKGEMFQPCSGTSTSRAWSQNEVNFQSHRKIHFSRLFLILVTGPHRYNHGSETCWTRESGRRRRTPMPNARSCNVVEREYKKWWSCLWVRCGPAATLGPCYNFVPKKICWKIRAIFLHHPV